MATTASKEIETERRKPVAVFMAFGTKGDVHPIAAIAMAFACDQRQYDVVLITHSAHEGLSCHLAEKYVSFLQVSSPPVLSTQQKNDTTGSVELASSLQERRFSSEHRQQCYLVVETIFGSGPSTEGDFIVINFFALEGWSLAELFCVRCMVAAPYVVPYSAPSTFERHFREELPLLYKYLQEAPVGKDAVTGLPTWHDRPPSPLLLYGFSKEVVECPGYWPSSVRVCGFWFLPNEWQFSCKQCSQISNTVSSQHPSTTNEMCSAHIQLEHFLMTPTAIPPVFIGLSSIGSMGYLKNPQALLHLLQMVLEITCYRFILFTAGYVPLDTAIQEIVDESSSYVTHKKFNDDCISLFNDRLFCFSGGTTAAALLAGIPQVICPFMLDQFYWAERMFWLGVAPEPLKISNLLPEESDDKIIEQAANFLSKVIHDALSPQIRERAVQISRTVSFEDGVSSAVEYIKAEMGCSS